MGSLLRSLIESRKFFINFPNGRLVDIKNLWSLLLQLRLEERNAIISLSNLNITIVYKRSTKRKSKLNDTKCSWRKWFERKLNSLREKISTRSFFHHLTLWQPFFFNKKTLRIIGFRFFLRCVKYHITYWKKWKVQFNIIIQ